MVEASILRDRSEIQRRNCCPQACPVKPVPTSPQIVFPKREERVGFDEVDYQRVIESVSSRNVMMEAQLRIAKMLVDAGQNEITALTTAQSIATMLSSATSEEDIQRVGQIWCDIFEEQGFTAAIDVNMMERNRWVADLISQRLRPGSVIDHDSGDSHVANFIQGNRPDVQVHTADSYDFRSAIKDLPFALYDYQSKSLPFGDEAFDQAIMATVLHHCDEPEKMFDEVVRTVKPGGLVILLENTFKRGDNREQLLNAFFDWFFNAILHKSGLPCPFAHFCEEEWEHFLSAKGLHLQEKLELGQWKSIPLPHVLYVAQKSQ